MTIDEYLNQLPVLKQTEKKAYNRLRKCFDRATSTHNSAFDGMPHVKSSENIHETRLVEYVDAKKEWDEINARFFEIKEQIENTIYYMVYWEAVLINQIYIYNVIRSNASPLDGVAEILNTNNQHTIKNKIAEAKAHLRQQLIDRGVEIE